MSSRPLRNVYSPQRHQFIYFEIVVAPSVAQLALKKARPVNAAASDAKPQSFDWVCVKASSEYLPNCSDSYATLVKAVDE